VTVRKIDHVKKRDGRIVPYDETKIAGAIFKAAQAVGGEDRYLATELARVVTMFLERYYAKDVPEIEDIHDMVEKVLIETGHARTAKAYILHRVNKARSRDKTTEAAPTTLLVTDPSNREAIQPWDRDRLRKALEREGACPAALAPEVARVVEERLLASGLRRVAPALIREFAANLLFERGLLAATAQHHDSDAVFEAVFRPVDGGVRTPSVVAREIGERALARFAREQVFLPDVVSAHQDARIHIWPLDEALRVESLPVPAGGDPAERVAWIAEHAAGGLLVTAAGDPERLRDALAATRHAGHVVRIPAGTSADTTLALARALGDVAAVEVTLSPAEFAQGLAGVRLLFERATPLPPLAQGAALNLPRIAIEAGADGTQRFFLLLDALIAIAVRAHLDRRDLLRRLSGAPGLPLSGLCVPGRTGLAEPFPEGMSYAVAPCGLAEAVRILAGREMHETEEAHALGVRIAAWIEFRLREESQRHRIRLVLSADAPQAATERLSAANGGRGCLAGARLRRGSTDDPRTLGRIEGRLHPLLSGARLRLDGPPEDVRNLLGWLHSETSASGVEWTASA